MTLLLNQQRIVAHSPNLLLTLNQHTYIPTYCYHPRLAIAANCRICSIATATAPDTLTSCNMPTTPMMEVFTETALTSATTSTTTAFILMNHPLDCPICDQGGECDLQDNSWSLAGQEGTSMQTTDLARTPVSYGTGVRTHMTRCITCTRCVRVIDGGSHNGGTLGVPGRGVSANVGLYEEEGGHRGDTNNSLGGTEVSLGRGVGISADLCPVGGIARTSHPSQTSDDYHANSADGKAMAWSGTSLRLGNDRSEGTRHTVYDIQRARTPWRQG